jgi:hypothetical protein
VIADFDMFAGARRNIGHAGHTNVSLHRSPPEPRAPQAP